MAISFTFQVFWMKIHSKLNKFRIKKLDCYIVSDPRFLRETQAILPETSHFLSAQMAVLSSFFQMFIILAHSILLEWWNTTKSRSNILATIFMSTVKICKKLKFFEVEIQFFS